MKITICLYINLRHFFLFPLLSAELPLRLVVNGMPKSCLLEPKNSFALIFFQLYVVSFVRNMKWKRRYAFARWNCPIRMKYLWMWLWLCVSLCTFHAAVCCIRQFRLSDLTLIRLLVSLCSLPKTKFAVHKMNKTIWIWMNEIFFAINVVSGD